MNFFLKSLFPNIPYFLKFSKWLKILRKKKIYGVVRGQIEDKFICFQEKWLPQIPENCGRMSTRRHHWEYDGLWAHAQQTPDDNAMYWRLSPTHEGRQWMRKLENDSTIFMRGCGSIWNAHLEKLIHTTSHLPHLFPILFVLIHPFF